MQEESPPAGRELPSTTRIFLIPSTPLGRSCCRAEPPWIPNAKTFLFTLLFFKKLNSIFYVFNDAQSWNLEHGTIVWILSTGCSCHAEDMEHVELNVLFLFSPSSCVWPRGTDSRIKWSMCLETHTPLFWRTPTFPHIHHHNDPRSSSKCRNHKNKLVLFLRIVKCR